MDTLKLPDPVVTASIVEVVVNGITDILTALNDRPFAGLFILLVLGIAALYRYRPQQGQLTPIPPHAPVTVMITICNGDRSSGHGDHMSQSQRQLPVAAAQEQGKQSQE